METEMTAIVAGKTAPSPVLAAFLSLPELALELGVTRKTLDRWAVEGKGPAITKIGRRVLYRRSAVDAWLKACERDPRQRHRRFGAAKNAKR